MEKPNSLETKTYIEELNNLSQPFLEKAFFRKKFQDKYASQSVILINTIVSLFIYGIHPFIKKRIIFYKIPECYKFINIVSSVKLVRLNLYDRLTEFYDQKFYGCITKHGDYYYYYYNHGLQNQRFHIISFNLNFLTLPSFNCLFVENSGVLGGNQNFTLN